MMMKTWFIICRAHKTVPGISTLEINNLNNYFFAFLYSFTTNLYISKEYGLIFPDFEIHVSGIILYVPLYNISFAHYYVCELHSCCYIQQYFIHFCYCITSHCMNMPQLIYPLIMFFNVNHFYEHNWGYFAVYKQKFIIYLLTI